MKIELSQDSIVNERTGQVDTPSEFLENLRAIETAIVRVDDDLSFLKADIKRMREQREQLIAQLRAGVREGRSLPLLAIAEKPDDDPDAGLALDAEDD